MDASAAKCDGSSECKAALHLHGCFSDDGTNCDHPSEHAPAAKVRVLDTTNSTLRGRVLTVVGTAGKRSNGRIAVSYLCVMPGYPHPGWFHADEVEEVAP